MIKVEGPWKPDRFKLGVWWWGGGEGVEGCSRGTNAGDPNGLFRKSRSKLCSLSVGGGSEGC